MKLNNEQLLEIVGGSLSGNLISALSKAINTVMDVGRSLGTAIRRIFKKNYC